MKSVNGGGVELYKSFIEPVHFSEKQMSTRFEFLNIYIYVYIYMIFLNIY